MASRSGQKADLLPFVWILRMFSILLNLTNFDADYPIRCVMTHPFRWDDSRGVKTSKIMSSLNCLFYQRIVNFPMIPDSCFFRCFFDLAFQNRGWPGTALQAQYLAAGSVFASSPLATIFATCANRAHQVSLFICMCSQDCHRNGTFAPDGTFAPGCTLTGVDNDKRSE